jgi:hypothetical protein
MSAAAFAKLLARPVVPTGVHVTGDLDLSRAGRNGITCHNCTFDGDVSAQGALVSGPVDLNGSTVGGAFDLSNATLKHGFSARGTTFERVVDLRHSSVAGPVDMSGATFLAPALFGASSGRANSFTGNVDFALATFQQIATFEGATFSGNLDFTLARFEGDAVFAGAGAAGVATFTRTTLSRTADFDRFMFNLGADFGAAEFGGPADFSLSMFSGPVVFDGARFASDVSFVGADFYRSKMRDGPDSFVSVHAAGGLDFALAEFDRTAVFTYANSTPVTSFTNATFGSHGLLEVSNSAFTGLQMSVGSVLRFVDDDGGRDRERLLSVLESSAKDSGNLGLANSAHYARQVLRSRHDRWYVHILDFVFYRLSAGYFVRPRNPIAVLAALAAFFAIARTFRDERAEAARAARRQTRRTGSAVFRLARRFSEELIQTIGAVAPRRAAGRGVPRNEVAAYRVLVACVLICFANSNPTLRQMLDAIR